MPTLEEGYTVRIPGAESIYHIIPDAARSPEDRATIQRARIARLESSPTPEIVRGVQSILTTIDDIQDGLVTLSLASRFVAPFAPGILPVAKGLAVGSDILNLATAYRTAKLVGGKHKASLFRAFATIPGTYSARLRRTIRTRKAHPAAGEWLQVLQTTNELAGVGLSIGAAIGLPIDLAFLAARGGTLEIPTQAMIELATLAPVLWASNPWIKAAALAGGFALSLTSRTQGQTTTLDIPRMLPTLEDIAGWTTPALGHIASSTILETAQEILSIAPLLDGLDAALSTEDHYAATIARAHALAIVAPFALANSNTDSLREYFPLALSRLSRSAQWRPTTQGPLDLGPPGAGMLPFEGSPSEITPADLVDELRRTRAPGPFGWIREDADSPKARAAGSIAGQIAAGAALVLEGPGAYEGPVWSEDAKAAGRMVEYNLTASQAQETPG